MRRGRRTSVIMCLAFLMSSTLGTFGYEVLNAAALISRGDITIASDTDFTSANGVVGGNGTPSDPYIIEGWTIDVNYAGISISNTQMHFIIRDVEIIHATSGYYGIRFTNAINGRIENSTIDGFDYGVHLENSDSNVIADNTFIGSQYSLLLSSSNRNAIWYNSFSGYGQWDVNLFRSHENLVHYNSMTGHRRGVHVTESDDNEVAHNVISGGSWGITVEKASRNTISHNSLKKVSQVCIEVFGGNVLNSDNVFSHNLLNECIDGIYTTQLLGSQISHNTFTNSSNGLHLSHSNGNDVMNNIAIDNFRAFYVAFSNDNTFVGNELITNQKGIVITDSDPNIIYHNNFLGNTDQAYDDGVYDNRWDAGYPAGGNYWSDYAGKDDCSGHLQDICPDPDGIGDTPYVDGHVDDRYPLMDPFGQIIYNPSFSLEAVSGGRSMGDVDIRNTRTWNDGGGSRASKSAKVIQTDSPEPKTLISQLVLSEVDEFQKLEISWTQNKFQCQTVLSVKRN